MAALLLGVFKRNYRNRLQFEDMEDKLLRETLIWLEDLIRGALGHTMETGVLEGLGVTEIRKGFLRSNLIVQSHVLDADGNWHVGAIATLIDSIGAVAAYTVMKQLISTVDFSISYYSTAKIQEHVEMDAKVMAMQGRLTQVVVEVRRKGNGELIALGKLWMTLRSVAVAQASRL